MSGTPVFEMVQSVLQESREKLASSGVSKTAAPTRSKKGSEESQEKVASSGGPSSDFLKIADACDHLAKNIHLVNDDRDPQEKLAEFLAVHEELGKLAMEAGDVNPNRPHQMTDASPAYQSPKTVEPNDSGTGVGAGNAVPSEATNTPGTSMDAGESGEAMPGNQPPKGGVPMQKAQPAEAANALETNDNMMMPEQPADLLKQPGGDQSTGSKTAGMAPEMKAQQKKVRKAQDPSKPGAEGPSGESLKEAEVMKIASDLIKVALLPQAIIGGGIGAASAPEGASKGRAALRGAGGGVAGSVGGGVLGAGAGLGVGALANLISKGKLKDAPMLLGLGGGSLGSLAGMGYGAHRAGASTPTKEASAGLQGKAKIAADLLEKAAESNMGMKQALGLITARDQEVAKIAEAGLMDAMKLAEDALNPAQISAGTAPVLQQSAGTPSPLSQGSEAGENTPRQSAPNEGEAAGRQHVQSIEAAINYTKGEAKTAPTRAAMGELVAEQAMNAGSDTTLQKSLNNTSEAGVKISAARELLRKFQESSPEAAEKLAEAVKAAMSDQAMGGGMPPAEGEGEPEDELPPEAAMEGEDDGEVTPEELAAAAAMLAEGDDASEAGEKDSMMGGGMSAPMAPPPMPTM